MQKLNKLFNRRRQRVRTAIRKNAADRVRLSVFRSGNHIYAQIIDDQQQATLAAASSLDKTLKLKNGATIEAAKVVGAAIAEKAQKANIKKVVFDRGGFIFHGRVKALADAAREAGLSF